MFEQAVSGLLLGALIGTLTGLIPGLHINIIAAALLGISFNTQASNMFFSCLIFSAASAQIFSSFIPAVFLGAPGSENFVSVLPGHRLLLQGKGVRAIFLSGSGAMLSMLLSILLLPLFVAFSPKIYSFAEPGIPYALIAVSLSMMLREESFKKKFWALFCFLLSGAFGLVILNSAIKNPLTPMLSGLFGVGMIASSMAKKQKIPKQYDETGEIQREELKSIPAAALCGGLVCTFPALGPGQAAAIASEVSRAEKEDYLILSGGISSANLILSLATAFAIGKARNGATAVAVQNGISLNLMIILACCAITSGAIAFGASMRLARIFSAIIPRINYFSLCAFSLLIISLITIFSSGIIGILALFSCAALGVVAGIAGINRTMLMGCLIIPVVLNYFL